MTQKGNEHPPELGTRQNFDAWGVENGCQKFAKQSVPAVTYSVSSETVPVLLAAVGDKQSHWCKNEKSSPCGLVDPPHGCRVPQSLSGDRASAWGMGATLRLLFRATHPSDFNSCSHGVSMVNCYVDILVSQHGWNQRTCSDPCAQPEKPPRSFNLHKCSMLSGSVAWLFRGPGSRLVSLDDISAHLHSTGTKYMLPLLIGKPQRWHQREWSIFI